MLRRETFRADDLVKVEGDFVVLASGGPLMEVESEEGDKVLCRWEEDGKIARAVFTKPCLRRLIPYV